jgi:hypothetical protein
LRSSAVQDDGYVYVKNAFLFSGVAWLTQMSSL